MKFVSRLPRAAHGDERYSVNAPEGGLTDMIDSFFRGITPWLDISVVRDFTQMSVRLVIEPNELISVSDTVFRVESATGVLLDEDNQPTGDIVTVTGDLNMEAVSEGMPAGLLSIWKRRQKQTGVA